MNLENGTIGRLVINHAVEAFSGEQEWSKLMLGMEASYAKEMPRNSKCAILHHAQLIVSGTCGMNGSHVARLVEEDLPHAQET